MNKNRITAKHSIIISAVTTVVVIMSASMTLGIQSQTWHTVLAQSAKNNTTTPMDNNKEEPKKGGPIGICSVGIKSACNGPTFDHP